MVGFDWAQFCALFGAIRKGEERSDNGMGKSGGTSGTSRIVSLVFSFGMIAAMLLAGGLKLGQMGASVLTAFELSVVTLVAISLTKGFYTAVSSLFFSGDIAFYLALPVGGTTIVWAKLANYMAGMMVVDLAMLPLSLGVLAGRGEGPLTWVVVVLAFLLCCVAVNVALVLVALPIVRFSKLVADKDRFARVFGLVSTVFALAIVLATTLGAYDGADSVDAAAMASMVGGHCLCAGCPRGVLPSVPAPCPGRPDLWCRLRVPAGGAGHGGPHRLLRGAAERAVWPLVL